MGHESLTLDELAAHLRRDVREVEKLVGRGRIPGRRVDGEWRFHPAEANYLFVDVRRDLPTFRAACQTKGLSIGRLYPPAETWARITIGTPDEMARAFAILETVL